MSSAAPPDPAVARIIFDRTYRIIPSRYPPVDLFERIADPANWELLAEIEGLTNDRLRTEIGVLAAVPVHERVAGDGATPIMAAFTHIGFPSRFTDGSFGVYYASDRFEAALSESLHHKRKFLRNTSEPRMTFDLRTYVGRIDAELHDIRGGWPEAHDPDTYLHSQALGIRLRKHGSPGIAFDSVRHPPAGNIAVFRPSVLRAPAGQPHTIQGPHLRVEWDGTATTRYIIFGEPTWTPLPRVTEAPA